jgi:hypothetical protein
VFLRTQDLRVMMCCVVGCMVPDIAKEYNAFIFKWQVVQE